MEWSIPRTSLPIDVQAKVVDAGSTEVQRLSELQDELYPLALLEVGIKRWLAGFSVTDEVLS
jgi:hypothetical protein